MTTNMHVAGRRWALTTVLLGLVLVVIDDSIVSIALPTLSEVFSIAPADAVWILNIYQIAAAACLIPFAGLGDIVGHRKVYCSGFLLFALGSLGCALADGFTQLLVARAFQGVGAAGAISVHMALTRFLYPESMLGRAISYNGLVIAITICVGPVLAGYALSMASWRWLFVLNLPFIIGVCMIGWKYLPARTYRSMPFDVGSAVLSGVIMILLITGIGAIGRSNYGWMIALAEIGAAGILARLLWRRERKKVMPFVPIDLFQISSFRLSICSSVAFFSAQSVALINLPFFFQTELGQSTSMVGLLMMSWSAAIAITAPISGRLTDKYNPALQGSVGLLFMIAGLLLLALLPANPAMWDIVWRAFVAGFGVAIFQVPNSQTVVGSAPIDRTGAAAGLQASARYLGQASGVAVSGLIFSFSYTQTSKTALFCAAIMVAFAFLINIQKLRN